MPPSRTKICLCIECVEKGGLNSAGEPRGVSWEMAKYRPHILRVKRSADREQDQQLSQASGEMFISTLVDREPSFDAKSGSPLPIEALVAGIQRMHVSNASSAVSQEDSLTSLAESVQHMHLSPHHSKPQSGEGASHKHTRPHINFVHSEEILRAALDQLRSCTDRLCHPLDSDDRRHVEDTVSRVQQAVDNLARKPASRSDAVEILSHEVQQKLSHIQSRLVELQNLSDVQEPLYFETGMWLSFLVFQHSKLCCRSPLLRIYKQIGYNHTDCRLSWRYLRSHHGRKP